MVKKTKVGEAVEAPAPVVLGPRPRLVKLSVKNFRCIGSTAVVIELDDIVVLVGPNNVGKSSVLKAYEVIMSSGGDGELSQEDFPSGKVDAEALPEIELHTVVYDDSPGPEWVEVTASGEKLVKEIWRWPAPGAPTRHGYNVQLGRWTTNEDKEKVPWGAPGIANSRRPQAHRVDAFASPDEQAAAIVKLLMEIIKERIKTHQTESKTNKETDLAKLFAGVADIQKKLVEESKEQIAAVQADLTQYVSKIFPGHKIVFDAKPEDDLDQSLNLFKANPQLRMGPDKGHLSTIAQQGSGARRTLLWTAIRLLAEKIKKKDATVRPHLLLLDEPEICLHPTAVREACDLLYGLPALTGNWQVMVTTHSPCFVDFARDHTSIVRVERKADGKITGTTIFRPEKAQFDGTDRELLKLLNQCDPYVAEFFFGGYSVIVEGDTEYTAFMHVKGLFPEKWPGIHVIRARGKATIISLCKILNQFGAPYAVLHDSDRPTYQKKNGTSHANPAWAHNKSILLEMAKSSSTTRLIASVPNFESAYLDEEVNSDKPYNALSSLKKDSAIVAKIASLLEALTDFGKPVPDGAMEWTTIEQLTAAVEAGEKPHTVGMPVKVLPAEPLEN
jgi:putative ATP-dependent endonuclease of OLD family